MIKHCPNKQRVTLLANGTEHLISESYLHTLYTRIMLVGVLKDHVSKKWYVVSWKPYARSRRSQMFFKINVFKNFVNFTGKHICNFIKKRLQHRCFPVKFGKFFKNIFFTEYLRWLFLSCVNSCVIKRHQS